MKIHEIDELKNFTGNKDLANLFHVHETEDGHVYNIMRTLYIMNMDKVPSTYFKYYQVIETDSWPGISYKLYGSIELWWLLLKLNNVKDPMFEPTEYEYIQYISIDDANEIITTIKNA